MGWLCIQLGLGDGVAGVPPFLLVVVVAGRGGGEWELPTLLDICSFCSCFIVSGLSLCELGDLYESDCISSWVLVFTCYYKRVF